MIQVYETDRDQNSGKNKENKEIERQTEFHKQKQCEKSGKKFHQRVSPGNPSATIPAFGTEKDKADNRYIIINTDGMVTVRTLGKRFDDGFLSRYAEYANIKETANGGAENEGKNI